MVLLAGAKHAQTAEALGMATATRIMAAVLEGAETRGSIGAADRTLVLRMLEHPAASASSGGKLASAVGEGVVTALQRALAAREAALKGGGPGAVIEHQAAEVVVRAAPSARSAPPRRAAVTRPPAKARDLPF